MTPTCRGHEVRPYIRHSTIPLRYPVGTTRRVAPTTLLQPTKGKEGTGVRLGLDTYTGRAHAMRPYMLTLKVFHAWPTADDAAQNPEVFPPFFESGGDGLQVWLGHHKHQANAHVESP